MNDNCFKILKPNFSNDEDLPPMRETIPFKIRANLMKFPAFQFCKPI